MSKRKRLQFEAINDEDAPQAKKQRLNSFENVIVPDLLDIFPSEIVEKILSNLSLPELVQSALISKYFYEISSSLSLWRHLQVKTTFDSLKNFGSRAFSVVWLNLNDVPEHQEIRQIAEMCPNLRRLDMICVNLNDDDMADLLKFKDLRVLNLDNCKFTDITLQTLSTHLSLRSLSMIYAMRVTEAGLNAFLENIKNLKHLSITYFTNASPNWKADAAKKYPTITFEDDDDNDAEYVFSGSDSEDFDYDSSSEDSNVSFD